MTNLQQLSERLDKLGIMHKAFYDCTKEEIIALCDSVLSSIDDDVPPYGWKKPFLSDDGQLTIPTDCHPRYRYWTHTGQCLADTLAELEAPYEVAMKFMYSPTTGRFPISEEEWEKYCDELTPF